VRLVLQGPAEVSMHWTDSEGQGHVTPLARESLELWLMPASFEERRLGLLERLHAPVPAEWLLRGNETNLYAMPCHRISSDQEFREILERATATGWPESPCGGTQALTWDWHGTLLARLEGT
jgi:hypothetical protein